MKKLLIFILLGAIVYSCAPGEKKKRFSKDKNVSDTLETVSYKNAKNIDLVNLPSYKILSLQAIANDSNNFQIFLQSNTAELFKTTVNKKTPLAFLKPNDKIQIVFLIKHNK